MIKSFLIFPFFLFLSLLNAQTIEFTLADPQPDLVDIYSGSSVSGDVDGDGDIDLFMSGISPSSRTALYLNDGSGNFTKVEDAPFPQASRSNVLFEDLDGDGDLDIFFSGFGASGVFNFAHVYLNDGAGNFTLTDNPSLPIFSDGVVDLADVDGDGDVDLLISAKDDNEVFFADIFLNNGNAIFTPLGSTVFPTVFFGAVKFIDVENDGDADVIISGELENETGMVSLFLNDGSGNFVLDTNTEFDQMTADDIDVADVDNDGNLDILMQGQTNASEVRTILYSNNGDGTFTDLTSTGLQHTFAGVNAIEDLDNDGDMDIVIIGSQAGGIPNINNIVYENMGNNEFMPVDTIGGEYIARCVVDDFNGDDLKDVIIQGFVDKTNVYWNTSLVNSIDALPNVPLLALYPNPSSGELILELEEYSADLNLYIYSANGQLVFEQANITELKNQWQLDLAAGTYFVQLKSESALTTRKLFIVK